MLGLRLLLLSALTALPMTLFSGHAVSAETSELAASALVSEARSLETAGKFKEAMVPARAALEERTRVYGESHLATAEALDLVGRLSRRAGNKADGLKMLRRALEIRQAQLDADDPEIASSHLNISWMLQELGEFKEALVEAQRALDIRQRRFAPHSTEIVRSLDRMGQVYFRAGDLPNAEHYLQLALQAQQGMPQADDKDVAALHNSLGMIYGARGDYAGGIAHFEEAVRLYTKALGAEHPTTGTIHDNLGINLTMSGRMAEAQQHFQQARAIFEKALGPRHFLTSYALNNLGMLRYELGDFEGARTYLESALSIRLEAEGPRHPLTARSHGNLALVQRLDDPAAALVGAQQARAIYAEKLGTAHENYAWALQLEADLLLDLNQPGEARVKLAEALAIHEESGSLMAAETLVSLARVLRRQGDLAGALAYVERAFALSCESQAPVLRAAVLDAYRELLAQQGRRPEAVFFGKSAVNELQALRRGLSSLESELQQSFVRLKEDNYRGLADVLIEEGRLQEAQQVIGMLKEQEYFDFIRRDGEEDPRRTQATYNQREATWATRYAEISDGLVSLSTEHDELQARKQLGLTAAEQTRFAQLEQDLRVGRAAFGSFLVEIRADFAQAGGERAIEFGRKDLESLRALQGSLKRFGRGTVVVHYLVTDGRLRILLTSANAQVHRQSALPAAELNKLVFAFRAKLQDPFSDPKAEAQRLYELMVAPIEGDLRQARAKHVMVSLDDTLRYVPYAALHDGTDYLATRYALSVFTPAARGSLERAPHDTWRAAGYGVTRAFEGYSPLPAVALELDRVVQEHEPGRADSNGVLDGEVRLDEGFTANTFSAGLSQGYPVIHVASHFKFQPGNEDQSFLLLGDGSKLTAAELRSGPYELTGVDLLTLSACETALGGRDANGREIEGLGGLAQNQGAAAVLATLWPVADESTARLMESFYRLRVKKDLDKAEALRRAQLEFIRGEQVPASAADAQRLAVESHSDAPATAEELASRKVDYRHPYFWAPFILMGNWL